MDLLNSRHLPTMGENASSPGKFKMDSEVSWIKEMNMTNCSRERQRFFEKYGNIDCSLLIAYWMMAGYLDPVESVQEAYEKGFDILMGLKREGMLCESMNKVAASTYSDLNHCSHKGHCVTSNLGFDDLLDLGSLQNVTLAGGVLKDEKGSLLLLDGDRLSELPLGSLKRLKYIACFHMPAESVKFLLENVDNPSLLLLRDCTGLSKIGFSFRNLMNLAVLEVSGAFYPTEIPELTQLQYLNLSGFLTEELPEEFFSKLKQLRWLILRECYELETLPTIRDLSNLEVLDLSNSMDFNEVMFDTISSPKLQMVDFSNTELSNLPHLETAQLTHLFLSDTKLRSFRTTNHQSNLQELLLNGSHLLKDIDLLQHDFLHVLDLSCTRISSLLSISDKVHLRRLILRGCSSLETLPPLEKLEILEVLDVSECELLDCLPDLCNQRKLEVLDLSGTLVEHLPSFSNPSCLRRLSLRGLELDSLETLASLPSLVELDLCSVTISSSEGFKVDFLGALENLQVLNLSQTSVADLPAMSNHVNLKELFLAGCPCLNTLPDVCILKSLQRLELTVRGHSSSFRTLVLMSSCDVKNDNAKQPSDSRDFFRISMNELLELIPQMERALEFAPPATNNAGRHGSNTSADSDFGGSDNTYKRKFEMVKMDLDLIKKHMNRMENSVNCKRACELLQHVMDEVHCSNSLDFQRLLHTVAKLKLLIPRVRTYDLESFEIHKKKMKKESEFFTSKDKANNTGDIINELICAETKQVQMNYLLSSYNSLTNNEKCCLLCFSVFPFAIDEDRNKGVLIGKSLEISKRMLIYWWVGEGFINIQSEGSVETQVSEQVTPSDGSKKMKTIEEIGEHILNALTVKGFIEPVIVREWKTSRCSMHPFVHSFVTEQAKKEKYFNFSNKNGKLTPLFKRSHRACLLSSQERIVSSCQLWAEYAKSPDKLKKFKTVKTLFNVDESVIHIKPEWFSKMKDLSVLHLGNWHAGNSEHIEVGDQSFLENLKKMKMLKLFSLQGVSTITKLPGSICMLSSLIILNLKGCHDLEELPAEIGSLINLTHLDISDCHHLTKLPKGIRLLSKLEVFKGFVIFEQSGDQQDKKPIIPGHWLKTARVHMIHDLLCCEKNKVCTLSDLLKLDNLRELSIFVNSKNFPDSEELQVVRDMENLRKLMISWRRSFMDNDKSLSCGQTSTNLEDNKGPEVSRGARRGRTLCNEPETQNFSVHGVGTEADATIQASTSCECSKLMECCELQSVEKDGEKKPSRKYLDQIEKLELWCLPNETAPDWLDPNQLKNLQKLYIRGGQLKKLAGGTNGDKWKVTTLRLKYLPNLELITCKELKSLFPKLTYLEQYKCSTRFSFICHPPTVSSMTASSLTSREIQATPLLVVGEDMTPLYNHARHLVSAKADLTNCFKHHQCFFGIYESIDCNLLIAYWIMAGYLNPLDSVEKAYEIGHGILVELVQDGLLKLLPSVTDGDTSKVALSTDTYLHHCRHLGDCNVPNLESSVYLQNLDQIENVVFTNGLLTDKQGSFLLAEANHLSKFVPGSFKSLKYIACYRSGWREDSEKPLFENVDYPDVVLLQDCRFSSKICFPYEKFRTLTGFEMSNVSLVSSTLLALLSELNQLQCLKLSSLSCGELPEGLFSKLKQLRCLILRSCPDIETLPSIRDLNNLEVLDLSNCSSLRRVMFDAISSPKLRTVDLSHTAMSSVPQLGTSHLTHLHLRHSYLLAFGTIKNLSRLRVLDIACTFLDEEVDLSQLNELEVLDLSSTLVTSVDSVSDKAHLRSLILHRCIRIEKLPSLKKLESLEVLDISGTLVKCLPSFANPSRLKKLSASGLELDSLEPLASLSSLVELDLFRAKINSLEGFKVDFLRSFVNLQTLDLSQTSVEELPVMANHVSLKVLLLADCPRLNTLPDLKTLKHLEILELPIRGQSSRLKKLLLTNSSGVKIEDEDNAKNLPDLHELSKKLFDLIPWIEKALESGLDPTTIASTSTSNTSSTFDTTNAATKDDEVNNTVVDSNSIDNNAYKRQLKVVKMDVECIRKHIDSLRDPRSCIRACKIMQNLQSVGDWTEDEFAIDFHNLQQLHHTVTMVKLLLPRTQNDDFWSFKTTKKKRSQIFSDKDKVNAMHDIVKELVRPETWQVQMDSLLSSYKSLASNEKHCLLCLSVFPLHVDEEKNSGTLVVKSLEIKKKVLIYWWAGEGLVNLHSEESTAGHVGEQAIPYRRGKRKKTIEEAGELILNVLTDKGFIQPVIKNGWETRRCCMNPFVHSFVIEQAKQEKHFNFSNKDGKLTPLFKGSHRACLLSSEYRILSSCELWAEYAKSPDKLKKFKTVKTLFNVNESIAHIKPEWFSEMKDLTVLHLGNWHSGTDEHIEVGDQKFLEDLKNMKLMKLFSLQGMSAISKLPDSVCKLANLMILDLRECHGLEELPADIGSLKNLTHLDISSCNLLYKLPKGISSLSKLEFLRGFVIYELGGESGDPHDKKENILGRWAKTSKEHLIHDFFRCEKKGVCTFRDLLELENLRDLSIVVKDKCFPDSEELVVLKQMENLRKLKIIWEKSLEDDKKSGARGQVDDAVQGDNKGHHKDIKKKPRREFLDQIEKLELWCLPRKTAPKWLVPEELKNLKKLYIKGGNLEEFNEGPCSNEWNVMTLRLRFLPDLTITWAALRAMFPRMTYLEKYECKKLRLFQCDGEGVWRDEYEFT